MEIKKCYNCGIEMNSPNTEPKETSRTKEHIPAKNLYIGYPDEYKTNRITVFGCWKCNHEYSLIDDEMRDAIGVMNDKNAFQNILTEKAIKNLKEKGELFTRANTGPNRELLFTFKYKPFILYNEKNFKGLFYATYGYPFPHEKYGIHTLFANNGDEFDDDMMNKYGNELYYHATYNSEWQYSGHPDIFQYIMKGITIDKLDRCTFFENLEESLFIICICKYHNNIEMITLAFDKEKFNIPM